MNFLGRPANRQLPMQSRVPDIELEATYEYKPFYVEPIVAWRAWSVLQRDDGRYALRSVTYNVFWPMREEIHSTCLSPNTRHDAPDLSCACGIYCVKEIEDAIMWALNGTSAFRVIGEVKIWGRVFQYEKGYICEFAYPARVLIPHDMSHWAGQRGEIDAAPEEIAFMIEDAYRIPAEVGWPETA